MNVTIYTGAPGCQKTRTMLRGMLSRQGRYLLAAPRIDLLDEHADWLTQEIRARGLSVPVKAIHGQQGLPDVSRRIVEACEDLAQERHAILLITHEALRSVDLSPFEDVERPWHARIDEVPEALVSGAFRAPAAAQYLRQVYDLQPSGSEGWWRVSLKCDAPPASALMSDTHLRELVAFDRRARSHGAEPHRVSRRPFGLGQAAKAWTSALA